MRDLASRAPRSVEHGETMAMALAEAGQYEEAATWQRDAMAAAEREGRRDLAERMTENLRLYARRRPRRTPWRDLESLALGTRH